MDTENKDIELASLIESLLFAYGEPIKLKQLSDVSGVDIKKIEAAIEILKEKLSRGDSGINIVLFDGKASLITKPEFGEIIQKMIKEELDAPLTPASLETLSIVAYMGPISRAEIEYIRGVNSSFILRNLMIRGLISKDQSSKSGVSYRVTFDFFKHIGALSAETLPDYDKYRNMLSAFLKPVDTEPKSEPINQ